MAVKKKAPESEPVNIGAKLRKAHPWFETLSQGRKDAAIKERRKKERMKGPQLPSDELVALADELEEIQQKLNPLETRRKEILDRLLPHWGHTGLEEIEGSQGRTLISTSFELGVDPVAVKKSLSDPLWHKLTARVLQAPRLLLEGKTTTQIRDAVSDALMVNKLRVSITAPSSRRPKSGETDDERYAA